MRDLRLAIVLGVAALIAGCGQKQESAAPQEMSGDMGNMAMAPEAGVATMAKGAGKVKAIDKASGSITLDHGPIPEAKWPAMTMAFKASPAILDSVKTGDKVAFDLKLAGSAGEVTRIQKQ